jgi:hypothetical protein
MTRLVAILRLSAGLALVAGLLSCSPSSDQAVKERARHSAVAPSATPPETSTPEDDCGLAAYPASRSNQQILADAPQSGSPTSSMMARVRVDAGGRVTHLRLIRRAYPEAPKVGDEVTLKAIRDLKERRFNARLSGGVARPQCVDITTTIDLR